MNKNEAVTNSHKPGNATPDDRVSQMREFYTASNVTDLSGGSGLPGVRPDYSDGKSPKVSSGPEEVAGSTIADKKDIFFMSLDEKLSLLNAFRKIRQSPPKIKDQQAKRLVAELYTKWIDDTMLQILHPGSQMGAAFTKEEVDALKVLAQTILQRQQNPMALPPRSVPMVQRTTQSPPTPLAPGVDDVKLRAAQATFLAELSKMERESPVY